MDRIFAAAQTIAAARRARTPLPPLDAAIAPRDEAEGYLIQAALADLHGLRALFAVTTEHRVYWDALPIDPLGPGEDTAIPVARDAFERATEGPWHAALERALRRTAVLAASMRALPLPDDSL